MASSTHPSAGVAVHPLPASADVSQEHLPGIIDLGVSEPVLAKNRRPALLNFVIPVVCIRADTRTVVLQMTITSKEYTLRKVYEMHRPKMKNHRNGAQLRDVAR